jgi:sec-independent protein translocase protein TatA
MDGWPEHRPALVGPRSSDGSVAAVNLGPTELLIVLLVVLVLFGGAKLPKLARSMGQAQNEFKRGLTEGSKDDAGDSNPTKPADS